MFPSKFLLVLAIPLWLLTLSLSCFHFEAYGDDAGDAKCDPPCQQQSPPISGYPSYGAPPPPPPPQPSSPPSGYSIYGPPPPPPHGGGSQSKCPPAAGVQCCTPPPPYNNYGNGYGPPNLYAPPNAYTYVPYNQGFASTLFPIQVPFMLIFSSFVFLF